MCIIYILYIIIQNMYSICILAMVFIFNVETQIMYFHFLTVLFSVTMKKPFSCPRPQIFMFSEFYIFELSYILDFEPLVVFMYDVKPKSNFILCHVDNQFRSTLLVD